MKMKKNDKIYVSNTGLEWEKRYFSHWKNGTAVCFTNGCTSWSADGTASWEFWKDEQGRTKSIPKKYARK